MSYNVFADKDGLNAAAINRKDAYEASALVNALLDAGYDVCSDLWGAFVPNAMITPQLLRDCGVELTQLGVSVGIQPGD